MTAALNAARTADALLNLIAGLQVLAKGLHIETERLAGIVDAYLD